MLLAPDDGIGVIVLANTGGLDGRGAPDPLSVALLDDSSTLQIARSIATRSTPATCCSTHSTRSRRRDAACARTPTTPTTRTCPGRLRARHGWQVPDGVQPWTRSGVTRHATPARRALVPETARCSQTGNAVRTRCWLSALQRHPCATPGGADRVPRERRERRQRDLRHQCARQQGWPERLGQRPRHLRCHRRPPVRQA